MPKICKKIYNAEGFLAGTKCTRKPKPPTDIQINEININKNRKRLDKLDNELNSFQEILFTDGKGSKGKSGVIPSRIRIEATHGKNEKKGAVGATGKQGERGPKGEVGATGKQGERGPKGEPGSSSVDTDIITGINSKISKLEKAVELDQKLPNSNNNNINYYLNRNYEITQTIFTELSGIYGRLAASELLIKDLTSSIGLLTERIEVAEFNLIAIGSQLRG